MNLDQATSEMRVTVDKVVASMEAAGFDVGPAVDGERSNCRDAGNERTENFSNYVRVDLLYGDDARIPDLKDAFSAPLTASEGTTSSASREPVRIELEDGRFELKFMGPGAASVFASTGCHPLS